MRSPQFMSSAFVKIATLNRWLGEKFDTTQRAILTLEIGAVCGLAFTMMQIGEHLVAIMIWLLLCALWIAKIFHGGLAVGNRALAIFERIMQTVVALAVCSVLVVIAGIRRGTEPWSNLATLWAKRAFYRHALTATERSAFEAPLKGDQKPPMHIVVSCPSADEKVCVYAAQFQTFFSEAGWDVDGAVQRVTLLRPMQGVVLVERGGTKESQIDKWKWDVGGYTSLSPTYENVYQAFSNIGIEPEGSANYAIPENQVTVYFGPERENESQPTDLTNSVANIRRLRKAGLLPAPGQLPTAEMIERSRERKQ